MMTILHTNTAQRTARQWLWCSNDDDNSNKANDSNKKKKSKQSKKRNSSNEKEQTLPIEMDGGE